MTANLPIDNKRDILNFFRNSAVRRNELLMGIEVERSGIYEQDLKPVPYNTSRGYLAIMRKLVREVGWQIKEQDESGNIFELKRGDSMIHVEGDGRLELSSKPRRYISNLSQEFWLHANEINEISKDFDIRWLWIGWHPFAKTAELGSVPKQRTTMIRKFFPRNNEYAKFSKKTNGVHVNFGFTSERDAVLKFQTILKLSPVIMAMYANSPLNGGKFSGYMCQRIRTNQHFCPERTEIQQIFYEKDFDFEQWIDYLLELPMIFIERRKQQVFMQRTTFNDFLKNGFERHRPNMNDFLLHLKSVWGEMRLKSYLEYRGIDCVPPHLITSIPALIRGITATHETMRTAQELVKNWNFQDHLTVRENVARYGLAAPDAAGKPILPLAKQLLELSSESLKQFQRQRRMKQNLSRLLWPIKQYVFVREQSPAEYVMEMWNGPWHRDPRKLLEWSES